MNGVAVSVATAATFLWLGMVLAISFLEAPLKFRAPGVDVVIGLAIGRVVFPALNKAEMAWAAAIAVALVVRAPSVTVAVAAIVAIALLVVQLCVVRPRLNRRSDRVLAGGEVPRSASHHVYIALEAAKVIALASAGVLLLSS
jgi:hypothetical protein